MVVYRDSDLEADSHDHLDLRRRGMDQQQACAADQLTFNGQPEHPLYAGMSRKDDSLWALFSPNNVFSKRQLDNIGGTGNSGVINLAVSIGKTDGCPSSRRVALVGVATDCGYTAAFGSSEAVRQNVITQINSASSLFEQTFKISLGLQNLTVSDGNCPSSPATATPWNRRCSSDATIQTRLNDFSQWRGNQQDSNSHWTLLTTCNTGSEVGLSWLGQTCVTGSHTANSSNGVETVSGANVAARTSTEWQVIA